MTELVIGNLLYELLVELFVIYVEILSEQCFESFFCIFYHILHFAILEDDAVSLSPRELRIIGECLSDESAKGGVSRLQERLHKIEGHMIHPVSLSEILFG